MATNPAIKPRRGTSTPGVGAILQNELAIDTTNKRIFIGAADGSGTLIGSAPGGSDTQVQFNDGGNLGGDSGLTYNKTTDTLTVGSVSTTGLEAKTVGGDEGGQIDFGLPLTSTTLSGGVAIDVYQNKLRIFEKTGSVRGVYIDLTSAGAGVGTNLLSSSATPGGSDTYVQFNDGGSTFGGDAGLTYNKTTDALTLVGDFNLNGGSMKSTQASVSILPATVTTLNIGGAATALTLGTTTGTTTINSPTVVGSQATQALYDTVATTMNFARSATSITMGSTTGSVIIRNPSLRVGNTTGLIITSTSASTNHLTLQPSGKLFIVPVTSVSSGGSIPSITVENTDLASGVVEISGGDLYLGRKTADDLNFDPVNIVFEGATNNTYETTLTVTDPTADQTITLPNSTGTVYLMSWSAVTADQSLAINTGVLANKSSGTLTLTLPTTAALGTSIRVSGMQNTWRVAQNASQKINFGKLTTTTGTGGYIESSNVRDCVEMVCCVANTEWNVVSSIGNITVA